MTSLYHLCVYFFEAAAALSALLLIFTRNLFYGALLLIVCLLSVAGLYVLAFAEFVAVTQIMVYAGGVLVLIIFGIMLTARLGEKPLLVQHTNVFWGALTAAAFFTIACVFFNGVFPAPTSSAEPAGSIESIGINLMTSYLVPFEIAGVLLLASLVGAAVIASGEKQEHQ